MTSTIRLTALSSFAIAALLAFTLSAYGAVTENRVALVIGNSVYEATDDLKNPQNDANAIANKLEGLGFDVLRGANLSYDSLRDTIRSFAKKARTADVTVFYYAGHGISVDGVNYIVPVDAKIDDPTDWEFEVYEVEEILRLVDRSAGPSLILLDACRDNPMAHKLASMQGLGSRSLSTRGLSRIPTEQLGATGTVVAYATEPGQVAADGAGENSPFAQALLSHLGAANTDFTSITSLITRDVLEMTDNIQRPRFDISLTGPLILNPVEVASLPPADATKEASSVTDAAPNETADTLAVQQFMFEAAKDSGDKADYQAYLDTFPQGMFASLARNAIKRLKKEVETAQQVDVAGLNPNGAAGALPASTRASMPLLLSVTDALRVAPSSTATEADLGLNKKARKEVQLRLNLSSPTVNVGNPDGAFGPNTRRGITAWQTSHGLLPTGYLNLSQHQFLIATTQTSMNVHMAQNPNALNAPAPTRKKVVRKKAKKKSNNSMSDAFIGGVIGGAIGSIFKK